MEIQQNTLYVMTQGAYLHRDHLALQVKVDGNKIFDGRVSALEGRFAEGCPAEIVVLLEDRFQDMRMTQRTRSFEDVSDADVMNRLARDYGLQANVDVFKKVQDLGEDEVNRIRQVIEDEGNIEGDLRKDVSMHIKRLMDIQSYRGTRHKRSLPVNGQRTRTNARTRKGPRKGTVAGKKKATQK